MLPYVVTHLRGHLFSWSAACGRRIAKSEPERGFPHSLAQIGGSDSAQLMRDLLLLAIHLFVTVAKLLRHGGVRAVTVESLFVTRIY